MRLTDCAWVPRQLRLRYIIVEDYKINDIVHDNYKFTQEYELNPSDIQNYCSYPY